MPNLLYRLTHRRYSQRATLRSLQVLGTALKMGCPLDQSLALTAELSETWGLREVWRAVAARLAHGESLSRSMALLQPPFSPALVAMVELGEIHGNMPSVLLAASGSQRFDAFSPQIQVRARSLANSCIEVWDKGPVPRIAESTVLQGLRQGADGVGYFIGLPNPMDGPRLYAEEVAPSFLDRSHIGSPAAAISPEPVESTAPLQPVLANPAASRLNQKLWLLDPGSIAAGQATVGFRKDGEWLHAVSLPTYVFPDLVRHLLFLARVPYWSTESRSGWIRMEVGDRWQRMSARFDPTARQLALTLYFDPAVTVPRGMPSRSGNSDGVFPP